MGIRLTSNPYYLRESGVQIPSGPESDLQSRRPPVDGKAQHRHFGAEDHLRAAVNGAAACTKEAIRRAKPYLAATQDYAVQTSNQAMKIISSAAVKVTPLKMRNAYQLNFGFTPTERRRADDIVKVTKILWPLLGIPTLITRHNMAASAILTAWLESRLNFGVRNMDGSSAKGMFQLTDGARATAQASYDRLPPGVKKQLAGYPTEIVQGILTSYYFLKVLKSYAKYTHRAYALRPEGFVYVKGKKYMANDASPLAYYLRAGQNSSNESAGTDPALRQLIQVHSLLYGLHAEGEGGALSAGMAHYPSRIPEAASLAKIVSDFTGEALKYDRTPW